MKKEQINKMIKLFARLTEANNLIDSFLPNNKKDRVQATPVFAAAFGSGYRIGKVLQNKRSLNQSKEDDPNRHAESILTTQIESSKRSDLVTDLIVTRHPCSGCLKNLKRLTHLERIYYIVGSTNAEEKRLSGEQDIISIPVHKDTSISKDTKKFIKIINKINEEIIISNSKKTNRVKK